MSTSREPARPLFVLGGHRGGTTLLQRVLNAYDDVAVWGEHAGVLTQIADAYFRGVENANLFAYLRTAGGSDARTEWQAWMSVVDRDAWDATFRRLVISLFPPPDAPGVRVWGFKEIRYGGTAGDRALDLLAEFFPDALVAFIVRNPFNMLASAQSRPGAAHTLADFVTACTRLATRFHTFLAWHRSRRLRSYWIVYEDLLRAEGDVLRLCADLGREFGAAQRAVLAANGSARGSSFRDAVVNERWRRLPPTWLAVARHIVGPVAMELGYPLPSVSPVWRLAAPLLRRRHRDAA